MKKRILVLAKGDRNWLGGVYYTRNILYVMSFIEDVKEKYDVFLSVADEWKSEFNGLDKSLNLRFVEDHMNEERIIELCDKYSIDIVFPVTGIAYSWIISDICIYWIPDFQELHFPENFGADLIEHRERINGYIARNHKRMILSSMDAMNDFTKKYKDYTNDVYVVHFSSYIENEIHKITEEFENHVFQKYHISYPYIYIANQFWNHKNHMVVLKAMEKILNDYHVDMHLVCTGRLQCNDNANGEYIQSILDYIRINDLENNIHLLGVVDRDEQLCIMKNARILIQPSLFEGWGCSVEDAKAMGKTIILSDINVHREQGNQNCLFFEKHNEEMLAEILLKQFATAREFDFEKGKKALFDTSSQYAMELENVFRSVGERKKEKYVDRFQKYRKNKILKLFGNIDSGHIGIYGTGWHTDKIMHYCDIFLQETNFVFFDSNPDKWGKEYFGGKIYSIESAEELGVERIVISSIKYQEEIFDELQKYSDKIEILKFYETEDEKYVKLFW